MTTSSLTLSSSRPVLRRFLRRFLSVYSGILFVVGSTPGEAEDLLTLLLASLQSWQTVRDIRSEGTVFALRTALRDDPDVIVVGEVKEGDLAHEVAQAALLGHFVIAVSHGEAVRTFSRFSRAVHDPFSFASTFLGMIIGDAGELRGGCVSPALREAILREEEESTLVQKMLAIPV